MDSSLRRRAARATGFALWVALVTPSFVGCASGGGAVVLHELTNGKVEATPVGVSAVVEKKEWRNGKRVTIPYATLLVHTSKSIRKQEVSTGDLVLIGSKKWQVVEVRPGGPDTRGVVVLEVAEE